MRLKYQLFITLLISSALLVGIMFIVSSLSFSRGFLSYVNNSQAKQMQPVIDSLEIRYAKDGSWDQLTSDRGQWTAILRASSGRNQILRSEAPSPNAIPTNRRPAEPQTAGQRQPPPRPPGVPRLILAGIDKQELIGQIDTARQQIWRALNHEGNLVGYVGFNKMRSLDNQFDQAFETQQNRAFALSGLCMVLLSAILAAILASRIVNPVLQVKNTIAEISQGNFAHRIKTKRKDEIGDLAIDINKLGATLEQNRDSRQRLSAEISHELRTPVAVLRGELEALQDGIRELNSSSIDSLHTETIKLNRLINDLHTLSLADAGGLDYRMEPVNLDDFVREQVKSYQAKETGLTISLDSDANHTNAESLYLNADKQRLEQLVANLMQNSTRYTDKPGTVSIQININTGDNRINLIWSDSAPGVSTEALDKLFDPLFRAEESRSRQYGGSGLGLSIVKKIADAHDGICGTSHSDAGGLKISISFPMLVPNL